MESAGKPKPLTDEEARMLADEIGRLQRVITEDRPALREKAVRYFKETGIRTIEGTDYRVRAVEYQRCFFKDKDAVLAILESAGLSHLAMSRDLEKLNTILDNPDLPWAVRRQLERLGEKQTRWIVHTEPSK